MSIRSPEGLKSFVLAQQQETENVSAIAASIVKKMARLPSLEKDEDLYESYCESIAFRIHQTYTGMENILSAFAEQIDEFTPNDKAWHAALIKQMSNPLGDRPAVISQTTRGLLMEIRGFRHVLRHEYSVILKADRVTVLGSVAVKASNSFTADLNAFAKLVRDERNDGGGDGTGGGAAGGPPRRAAP